MKKQTWQQWARVNAAEAAKNPSHPSGLRGKGCLAPLTGTDVRALDAFVACLELYAHTCDERVLEAARIALEQMQESTRWIARELIPFVLDWDDRERIWPRIVGERGERLHAVPCPAEDARLGLIVEWTHEHGAALKPTAGSADTFGDGMREAKKQVARIIAREVEGQRQETLKVFYSDDFEGVWPVGTAAVVIAATEIEARRLLDPKLPTGNKSYSLREIPSTEPAAIVLRDGDY